MNRFRNQYTKVRAVGVILLVTLGLLLFSACTTNGGNGSSIGPSGGSPGGSSGNPGSNNGCISAYSSTILADAPVAFWRLGDIAGTAATDSSGNNQNGAYVGGYTLGVTGAVTGDSTTAVSFDGVTGYVSLADSLIQNLTTSSSSLSLESWFQTTSAGVVFSVENTALPGVPSNWVPDIYVGSDGLLRGELWMGSVMPITTSTTVTDGNWHYVVLTASASNQSLYLDGNLVGTLAGTIEPLDMSKNYVGVGETNEWPGGNGTWSFFNGALNEMAVYSQALTPSQIQNHFSAASQTICQ